MRTALACLLLFLAAEPQTSVSMDEEREHPETVVRRLYDLVTFEAGSTPDWDAVRAELRPRAVEAEAQ